MCLIEQQFYKFHFNKSLIMIYHYITSMNTLYIICLSYYIISKAIIRRSKCIIIIKSNLFLFNPSWFQVLEYKLIGMIDYSWCTKNHFLSIYFKNIQFFKFFFDLFKIPYKSHLVYQKKKIPYKNRTLRIKTLLFETDDSSL